MNVEALHVFVGDVGGRVRYYRELVFHVVSAVLLTVHVVGFLTTDRAVTPRDVEDFLGMVDVNVDPGFAFGAGKNQRITEIRQRLPQFAPVDIDAGDYTLRAKAEA